LVHIVMLAEGYSDSLKKFELDWHGKIYANGKAKLRVREVKLYTFGVNEVGAKECLADLGSLTGGYGLKNNKKSFKFGLMHRLVRIGCRLFGVKKIRPDMVGEIKSREEKGYVADKAVLAHFLPIGYVDDPRLEKDCSYGRRGEEVV